ncbi:papain family cysteine protease domain containing protein [Entamoeba histolytica HM-1:IMSS-B]|uniref:Papain family cysteine protease domain containing protein n=6 Tax=Entamoeba histolytica TaxID=5759 RepID=C4LV58_ENTH1|nr:hypothetical protein EHI_182770 [Entamoeba histolytica HM-1:IMSS]EMD45062.1 papain family cysteine protease domain containing protein [Entamoeba histolytica KU27]EMH72302.1 papain family cysteine protease domain containing protein [Entamoeba histolytica HM-1:IMSS-B]EMS10724.1 papain family cysteine protease domain containing protein [Entamoeba histolytica HM-3:IMSS]ENY63918.1 papain family cysteine protease domain containing protein [Entamoeba histolytica HM-1:IMSS-A]GAT92540.1 hypothetical|eukprot:XP_655479.1 hypothetical protein EHI_182770 [Entamoeba histolytica HM-1:IMSS]
MDKDIGVTPLLNPDEGYSPKKKHNTIETFCTLWMILSMITFVLFGIVLTCCMFLSTRLEGFTTKIIDNCEETLPSQYLIPQNASVIPKNQQSRGSCWIFSTIGYLESSYRAYGLRHNLLNSTEYVQFSEQAYGKLIFEYCQKHKEIPICNYGGMGINQTSDGSVEFIYYLGDYAKNIILPTSVCNYYPERGEGEFHCNDEELPKIMATNPLNFTIKSIKTMYSVDEIKQTMYEHKSPISYGLATVQKAYYFECNEQNPQYKEKVCTECEFPCYAAASGEYIRDDSNAKTCCSRVGMAAYSNDGIFDLHGEVMGSGGHAMIIVGWNDEFRVDRENTKYIEIQENNNNRDEFGNKEYNSVKGGFIIKNSWGNAGHSMAYWMQNISEANEAIICPLTQSVKNWGPVDIECLKEKKTYKECGFGRIRHVGIEKKTLLGGTKLQCRITSNETSDVLKMSLLGFEPCSHRDANEYIYSLVGIQSDNKEDETTSLNLKNDIPKLSDTQRIFYIAKIKLNEDNNTIDSVEEIKTNMTTLNMLEKVFKPMADEDVQNSIHCGYYFQPYSTIRFLVSDYKAWGYESYAFSYMDIEWDKKSYLKGNEDNIDYQWIKNSTVNYEYPQFDGPFGDLLNSN